MGRTQVYDPPLLMVMQRNMYLINTCFSKWQSLRDKSAEQEMRKGRSMKVEGMGPVVLTGLGMSRPKTSSP